MRNLINLERFKQSLINDFGKTLKAVDDYLQRYQTFLEDNTISETLREDFMYALNTDVEDIDDHEEEVDDDDPSNIEE